MLTDLNKMPVAGGVAGVVVVESAACVPRLVAHDLLQRAEPRTDRHACPQHIDIAGTLEECNQICQQHRGGSLQMLAAS